MNDHFEYFEPWTAVGRFGDNLVKELERELTEQHPLWRIKVRAIAQRTDSDDVLFQLEGDGPQFAVVHLTWTGEPEADCNWPDTCLFATLEQWTERMMLDHEEFMRGDGQR